MSGRERGTTGPAPVGGTDPNGPEAGGRPSLEEHPETTLDPATPGEWQALRELAHRMVDDVVDYHAGVRRMPAWRAVPEGSRRALEEPVPRAGQGAEAAYRDFLEHVCPYPYGNIHPRHWGWVNGQGTTLGSLAELWATAMNPNCWGGEHGASYVEARVLDWLKELLGWPQDGSGLLVSGGSVANLVGLAAARDDRAGERVSAAGLAGGPPPVLYASAEAHNSIDKAAALLGVGTDGLRRIPVDDSFRMDVRALRVALAEDRREGRRPFCVAATAGTVNTGAIDPLHELADLCAREDLWLHVDAAFGAAAALSPALRPLVRGMERADSLAFDLHKWLYMPIEAGCVLVRDRDAHRRPFSPPASYLASFERGIASGPHAFSVLGPQLTRGFRALKVWLSLKAWGSDRYARLVEQNVRQARRLEARVRAEPRLELLAGVPLNVVCFRYRTEGSSEEELNGLNRELLMRIQESGVAAPSSTVVRGAFALRAAFTNHRTRMEDVDLFVDAVLELGGRAAREPSSGLGETP